MIGISKRSLCFLYVNQTSGEQAQAVQVMMTRCLEVVGPGPKWPGEQGCHLLYCRELERGSHPGNIFIGKSLSGYRPFLNHTF